MVINFSFFFFIIEKIQTQKGERQMPQEAEHTADTFEFFNDLFDHMNGLRDGKKSLMTSTSDHIDFFKTAKGKLMRMRFVDQESHKPSTTHIPCLRNLINTVESFIQAFKLLQRRGFEKIDPSHFNQDTLENLFSLVRNHNSMPSCYLFSSTFKSIMISNTNSIHSLGSNCKDDGEEFLKLDWNSKKPLTSTPTIDPDLSIPRDLPRTPFFEHGGLSFTSLKDVNSAFVNKIKSNKITKSCADCQKFLENNEINRKKLDSLYDEIKPVMNNILGKIIYLDHLKKRTVATLKKEIQFYVFTSTCKNHLTDIYLDMMFTNFINSITKFTNQVLKGKPSLIEGSNYHPIILSASTKFEKTKRKVNRTLHMVVEQLSGKPVSDNYGINNINLHDSSTFNEGGCSDVEDDS